MQLPVDDSVVGGSALMSKRKGPGGHEMPREEKIARIDPASAPPGRAMGIVKPGTNDCLLGRGDTINR